MSSSESRRLAREIAHLRRDLDSLLRSSQLGHSSVEGGSIKVYDDNGVLRHIIGEQADGTYTYTERNGPPPQATPSAPRVYHTPGVIWVYWDGKTADGSLLPQDLEAVEIYLDDDSSVESDLDYRRGVIASPYSGPQFMPIVSGLYNGDVFAALRFLNRSGQRGPMSESSDGWYWYLNDNATPPSAPIVTRGNSGEIYVTWNGLDANGDYPGQEQQAVEVHIDDDPTVEVYYRSSVGSIDARNGSGTCVIAPGRYSASFQYFALAFRNQTGELSPPSAVTQA